MKKNTKGFTLIELLAVIVILAIIALIATPIVLNLINKARQGAAQDSAYGVRKAAQLFYQTKLIDDINGFTDDITITFTTSNGTTTYAGTQGTGTGAVSYTQAQLNAAGFNIDGTVPTSGTITISATNGNATALNADELVINGWYCQVPATGSITCGSSAYSA